jgi:uncharacterized protein YoxC
MNAETVNAIVAGAGVAALVVIALAALIAAIALWRVARDVRGVTLALNETVAVINAELPPTIKELRDSATNLRRVSDELSPRIARVDALLDETDATVQSLRATVEAAEDIVRGPSAAVDRARRAAGAASRALASGADRLRHSVEDRMNRGPGDNSDEG